MKPTTPCCVKIESREEREREVSPLSQRLLLSSLARAKAATRAPKRERKENDAVITPCPDGGGDDDEAKKIPSLSLWASVSQYPAGRQSENKDQKTVSVISQNKERERSW